MTKKNLRNIVTSSSMAKIAIVVFFIVAVGLFSLQFLQSDEDVYVQMILTESDSLKTWTNYPDAYYMEKIVEGMSERDELGRKRVEVIDVYRINTPNIYDQVRVTLRVKANYNQKNNVFSYNGQPLVIGDYQRIKVGNTRLKGSIVDISSDLVDLKQVKVLVRGELVDGNIKIEGAQNTTVDAIRAEMVQNLQVGDAITDSEGQKIFEISNLDIRPAYRTLFDTTGSYSIVDPNLASVDIEAVFMVTEIDGHYYWLFDRSLQVGETIEVFLDEVVLPFRVSEVVTIQDEESFYVTE